MECGFILVFFFFFDFSKVSSRLKRHAEDKTLL